MEPSSDVLCRVDTAPATWPPSFSVTSAEIMLLDYRFSVTSAKIMLIDYRYSVTSAGIMLLDYRFSVTSAGIFLLYRFGPTSAISLLLIIDLASKVLELCC